jgi:hypothetical protein
MELVLQKPRRSRVGSAYGNALRRKNDVAASDVHVEFMTGSQPEPLPNRARKNNLAFC